MTTVKLQNLDCANCAGKIEKRLNELDELITSPINNLNYSIILYGKNRCKKIITQRVV